MDSKTNDYPCPFLKYGFTDKLRKLTFLWKQITIICTNSFNNFQQSKWDIAFLSFCPSCFFSEESNLCCDCVFVDNGKSIVLAVGLKENEAFLDWIRKTAEEKNASPAQISLAWMLAKKPYIVPIPGTRKLDRLKENLSASEVVLSAEEVQTMDAMLEHMPMSQVFGGSAIKK